MSEFTSKSPTQLRNKWEKTGEIEGFPGAFNYRNRELNSGRPEHLLDQPRQDSEVYTDVKESPNSNGANRASREIINRAIESRNHEPA